MAFLVGLGGLSLVCLGCVLLFFFCCQLFIAWKKHVLELEQKGVLNCICQLGYRVLCIAVFCILLADHLLSFSVQRGNPYLPLLILVILVCCCFFLEGRKVLIPGRLLDVDGLPRLTDSVQAQLSRKEKLHQEEICELDRKLRILREQILALNQQLAHHEDRNSDLGSGNQLCPEDDLLQFEEAGPVEEVSIFFVALSVWPDY